MKEKKLKTKCVSGMVTDYCYKIFNGHAPLAAADFGTLVMWLLPPFIVNINYELFVTTIWFCVMLPAVGQQSKTVTQASVKPASTTVTSAAASTPGKPGTSTAAKPQEPAKKKLEKVDLNAVKSFTDLVLVMSGTGIAHYCGAFSALTPWSADRKGIQSVRTYPVSFTFVIPGLTWSSLKKNYAG